MTETTLLPHQERVVTERDDLNAKVEALTAFRGTTTFTGLDAMEQSRLSDQLKVMNQYLAILGERIAAFE